MDQPSKEAEDLDFSDILKHLDRESEHFTVKLETHHSGRLVTIVQPHSLTKDSPGLVRLGHMLKESLGTGGDVEEGKIILHGDHRDRVRDALLKLGFSQENVEVI